MTESNDKTDCDAESVLGTDDLEIGMELELEPVLEMELELELELAGSSLEDDELETPSSGPLINSSDTAEDTSSLQAKRKQVRAPIPNSIKIFFIFPPYV